MDTYKVAARAILQQILPPGFPATPVLALGAPWDPATFHAPAFTILAKVDRPVQVKWVNDLKDTRTGYFIPHLFAVDQTLHWANPPGGEGGRDSEGTDPSPYRGPIPMVIHLHGAHTDSESDGYPESWYLPDASDIPEGYARTGSHFDQYGHSAQTPGNAVFQYENDQAATTLWFHDHTLGMTRVNIYAGLAGFYILSGGPYDAPRGVLPAAREGEGARGDDGRERGVYDIPVMLQDKSFNADGTLFFPDSREFFDGFAGPYAPETDIPPLWNPEFFGNFITVNGTTWPFLKVEPRRYRFRFLDASNARFYILRIVSGDPEVRPAASAVPFWQIGGDGGFLPHAVRQESLLLSPAERQDVIVDFTGLLEGQELYLVNEGPDEPFGGGEPGVDFDWADPATTGQVMKFKVGRLHGKDRTADPETLALPAPPPPGTEARAREVSMNEMDSSILPGIGPSVGALGTVALDGTGVPLMWADPVTETPKLGDTEVWEIHNYTEDAHPVHVHLVQFRLVDRIMNDGTVLAPSPGETGPKDTVIAYPDQITRIRATFDKPGLFVWHCHITDHEDHDMMRPFLVQDVAP